MWIGPLLSLGSLKFVKLFRKANLNSKIVRKISVNNIMSNCLLLPEPVKSPNDKRLYRAIQLENGLKALLISDTEPLENSEEQSPETRIISEDSGSECDSACDEGVEDDAEDEVDTEDEEHATGKSGEQKEKKAAAALCVQAGSFSDPQDLPGLAHYLEHMLFMGSEKYPDENHFDQFIRGHGGNDNACTNLERTSYELEINTESFREALDIFAQFFIGPLMKKSSLDRELEGVDSEFKLIFANDSCRKEEILATLAKKGNPLGKFTWGNVESLKTTPESQGINVYSRIREFWENNYSSHLMTLCVISRESLDTLQDWVVEIFSPISRREITAPTFEGHENPFATPEFHQLYKVSPVKKIHQVALTWSLPSLVKHYKIKPLGYLGFIVGHEGNGSILDYLKKRVWATSLEGGNNESNGDHNALTSAFSINITLTDAGFKHLEDILLCVFQYLDMLRKSGPQQRIYDELQKLDEMNFRFKEEEDACDYVSNLCNCMQIYDLEDVLRGDQMMTQYDEDLIRECTDALTPDNCNIMISSYNYKKDNPCDKTEKWMQTPYSQEDIPEEWINLWKNPPPNPEFYLPEPNKFIATDFDIKMTEENFNKDVPMKLKEKNSLLLWYKKDLKFHVPKGHIFLVLRSSVCKGSPPNSVLLDLLLYQLDLNLSCEAYSAKMAALSYYIYFDDSGLIINISGFNHKLPVLLSTILDYIVHFNLTDEMFEAAKIEWLNAYYNNFIKPRKLGLEVRLSAVQQTYWTAVEKRYMLGKATIQGLKTFHNQLISNLSIEMMVHGNFTPEEALEVSEMVDNKLHCSPLLPEMILPQLRTMKLPVGEKILRVKSFNSEDSNSAVTNYYQVGPGTIQLSSSLELLLDIMSEPCFDQLRTREQLGYIVGCDTRNTFGVVGFMVNVCSPADKFSCSHLDDRIEGFLEDFRKKIQSLSEDEFQSRVSALIKSKNCGDLYMGEEASRNWSEVVSTCYVFDRIKKETDCLQKLKLDEFKELSETVLDKSKFRKLSVQVVGCGDVATNECVPFTPVIESNDEVTVDEVFKLQYLHSTEKCKDIFVDEIAGFKSSMSIYPVCRF